MTQQLQNRAPSSLNRPQIPAFSELQSHVEIMLVGKPVASNSPWSLSIHDLHIKIVDELSDSLMQFDLEKSA